MHRTRLPAAVTLAVVTAAVGAGCSPGQVEPVVFADLAPDAHPALPADEPTEWASPLAAFLGLTAADTAAQVRAAEEAATVCMAAAGFDYSPVPPDTRPLPGELTTLRDAMDHGYGLTIRRPLDPGAADPNEATYAALPMTERQRWDDTLFGTDSDATTGCLSQSTTTPELALDEALTTPEFAELGDRLAELETAIVGHPSLTSGVERWSACMSEAGYPDLSGPGQGFEHLLDRTGRAVGVDVALDGFDTAQLDGLPDEELAALQEYERAIAVADLRCLAPFQRVEQEIRTDLENEFVEDNRDALNRLRESTHGER